MLNDEQEKFIPTEATYATVSHGIKENNGLLFALVGIAGLASLIISRKHISVSTLV